MTTKQTKDLLTIGAIGLGAWYGIPALGRAIGSGWAEPSGSSNRYGAANKHKTMTKSRQKGRRASGRRSSDCGCGG